MDDTNDISTHDLRKEIVEDSEGNLHYGRYFNSRPPQGDRHMPFTGLMKLE